MVSLPDSFEITGLSIGGDYDNINFNNIYVENDVKMYILCGKLKDDLFNKKGKIQSEENA